MKPNLFDNVPSTPAAPIAPPAEPFSNHIYFYDAVTRDSCRQCADQLRQVNAYLSHEAVIRGHSDTFPIWLHIQSYGGGVFEAFGLVDQIRALERPVYSVVEGCAASAGTIISCSCNKRYITPTSYMLIHSVSWGVWGKYEDWEDSKHLMDMLMKSLTDHYVKYTGMKRKQVRKLLKRDSWFHAQQCVELGLVDWVR